MICLVPDAEGKVKKVKEKLLENDHMSLRGIARELGMMNDMELK